MHRSMTLKQRITLGLAAFLLALAAQIFLSFYQSGTVLRELDDQMGRFNAISRFQDGVERSLTALSDYRWEYGDADELLMELDAAFSTTNAWLWRIDGDLSTVSEGQYLLYNAVCTTYKSYTALVKQLEEAVRAGDDAGAAQLYYNKVSPCGSYLGQYTQQLDSYAFQAKVCARCTVFPDLSNAELQNDWGVAKPEELLGKLLIGGEFDDYVTEVFQLNGFKTENELVDEAKN